MIEIDRIVNSGNIIFYDGIDFEYVAKYEGKDMLVFFIDNWNKTLKTYERNNKINYLLGLEELKSTKIDNNYVVIYQTNGYLDAVYNTIKTKFMKKNI